VDTLLQVFFMAGIAIVVSLLSAGSALVWPEGSTWVLALLVLSAFSIYYGYFALFEAIWNGQTPGKRYVGLRVIKDSGSPITVYESVARNLLRIVDQFPAFYGIGILSVLLSRQNRRLGDYVAGTVVVRERSGDGQESAWGGAGAPVSMASGLAGRLGADELALVETFLARRSQLDPIVRSETAERIRRRLAASLHMPPDDPADPETFLERLASDHGRP
jgi:uncharacterized RDD family membrane protein YckC